MFRKLIYANVKFSNSLGFKSDERASSCLLSTGVGSHKKISFTRNRVEIKFYSRRKGRETWLSIFQLNVFDAISFTQNLIEI